MKIYLQDENYQWKDFEYTDISEIKEAFESRSIKIGAGAKIGDNAEIGYGAKIGASATIGAGAKIGYRAEIGYGAKIGDHAKIRDRADLLRGMYMWHTTKHPLTYTGNATVSIGCHNMSIQEWQKKFEVIGRMEGYTDNEVSEYGQLIGVMAAFINIVEG